MSKFRALSKALALALILSPMSVAAGCATIEQAKPKTAREALAKSEILLAGCIDLTSSLYSAGVISQADLNATYIPAFEKITAALNTAETLLRLNDQVSALRQAENAGAQLDAVIALLSSLQRLNP